MGKELETGFRFLLHSRQDAHHQETLIQAPQGEGWSTPSLAGSDGKVRGHYLQFLLGSVTREVTVTPPRVRPGSKNWGCRADLGPTISVLTVQQESLCLLFKPARWVALGENHACGSYRGVFLSVPGSRDLEIIRSWIKRRTAMQHFLSPFQTMFLMGPLGAHVCVRACVCGHKASPSTKGAQSFSSLRFCIYKVNS